MRPSRADENIERVREPVMSVIYYAIALHVSLEDSSPDESDREVLSTVNSSILPFSSTTVVFFAHF